jgi:hypothetical protein
MCYKLCDSLELLTKKQRGVESRVEGTGDRLLRYELYVFRRCTCEHFCRNLPYSSSEETIRGVISGDTAK